MEDFILREMDECGADGVDFVPIWLCLDDSMPPVYKSYTRQEWIDSDGSYPKTNRKYWRMVNGQKQYVDKDWRVYLKDLKQCEVSKFDIETILKEIKIAMEELENEKL